MAMQTQNRFFDDLARLLGGAAGVLSGVRNEIESMFYQQLERLLANMDLVSRDTFDALYTMTQATRTHQENLDQRLAAFETRVGTRGHSFSRRLPRRHAAANLRQTTRRHLKNRQAPVDTSKDSLS